MKLNRSQAAVGVGITVSALLLAACSSSGGGGGSTAGDASSPIIIGLVQESSGAFAGPELSEFGVGFNAAYSYVNAKLGGFGGRQVKIITCDTQSSSAGAVSCANEMVQDKAMFVAGLSIYFGVTGLPILQAAHIPYQGVGTSTQEATNLDSFSMAGDVATTYLGLGSEATSQMKSRKGAMVEVQLPEQAVSYVRPYYAKVGGTVTDSVLPATTTDITSTVASALVSKPDIVIQTLPNGQAAELYASLYQQGFPIDRTLAANGNNDVGQFFSKVTPAAAVKGAIVETTFASYDDTSDPQVATYRAAMAKYGATSGRAYFTEAGFSYFMTDYAVAKAIGFKSVDKANFYQYFATRTVPIYLGYEYSRASAPKQYPSLGEPYVRFVQWNGSEIVDISHGWLNPFTGQFVKD